MSHESESELVAQDFRDALEDLQSFNRDEINGLTMIARENTEHALAISGALQEHIKRVVPQKKLPALYVLDSIVKNVGTPYTLYFGRKLFQTFMDAYASVDMPTRRKMDEMLRTWKAPVAGSLDTRPIFPPDVTRPIENALIKARTNALQVQREQARGHQHLLGHGRPLSRGGMPYRDTPTPPGAHPPQVNGYPSVSSTPSTIPGTNGSSYANSTQPPASYSPHPSQPPPTMSTPQPTPALMAFQPPQIGGYGVQQTGISVDALKDDIHRLIEIFKAQMVQPQHDASLQSKLKGLVDLQTLLQNQTVPQEQLVLVKKQIADLAVTIRAPPPRSSAPTSTPIPLPQSVAVAPPPAAAPKVSLDSLFGAGALAAIMARNSVMPQAQSSAPYAPPSAVSVHAPPAPRFEPQKPVMIQPAPPPPPPPTSDPMALMNMLRQAGLLPGGSSTGMSKPTSTTPFRAPLGIFGAAPANQPARLSLEALTSDIVLRPSSLKQFRPHLLPFLFEALGPQCTQCGRRFPTDEEGKKKKTAHMDWHFRVNQRMADVEKRGQHRSWLVDERDWINTRETVDKDYVSPSADSNGASSGSAPQAEQMQYIPVPDDPALANSVCSICQEKFETRWLDDAQEFVWPDTMRVGEKIYHASCYREAFKDGGNTSAYPRNTPEPVTLKRKAEDELSSTRVKLKVEGA
ncbi:hypothetical protein F4677DRAFT_428084 [Hypoxylon crocopeplum]|nr:hypothetical protein F4677DRAFT_428084 [Hypoxylon crocopeplum]